MIVPLLFEALLAGRWGSPYLLIKVSLTSFPPKTLMAVRVTLAACFLLVVLRP